MQGPLSEGDMGSGGLPGESSCTRATSPLDHRCSWNPGTWPSGRTAGLRDGLTCGCNSPSGTTAAPGPRGQPRNSPSGTTAAPGPRGQPPPRVAGTATPPRALGGDGNHRSSSGENHNTATSQQPQGPRQKQQPWQEHKDPPQQESAHPCSFLPAQTRGLPTRAASQAGG
ncbi:hypothetical protein CB1_000144056 [Camelus ferus]|nr:hypothetical protein CB1_000144056 [Camelus ferus]